MKQRTIKALPVKSDQKGIGQGVLDLGIEKDAEINGIGMGVLSDGTPYLNQRGLAALCGVQNAHIGTISSQWNEAEPKPRIQAIKGILSKIGLEAAAAHIEVPHNGVVHYCYPAEICLAILEYYAFDAGTNCQPEARDNFRILAGTKLREMIYSQVGYDPTGRSRFDKWHERIAMNYQSAPRGFFSVFNEAETLIYEMIVAGAPVDEKNVIDISIGRHWSKYWDDNGFNDKYGDRSKFPHRYPDSHPQSKSTASRRLKIDCLAWASRSCANFDPYPALRVGEGNTRCPAGSTLLNKEVNAMPISLAAAAQTYREAARDAVRRHSTFHLVQAALLVVAGIVAIVFPAFSSAAAVVVFGWLLIASGIIQAIGLISARHAPNFWLQIISAILGVLLGILLLRNIAQGMLLLSLLLIIFFMIEGMSKVVFALTIRPLPNWLWVFASGVLSVVLSLVLFAAMPVTALWLIGLMLGLDLIAIGAALGAMAWRLRGQAVPAA